MVRQVAKAQPRAGAVAVAVEPHQWFEGFRPVFGCDALAGVGDAKS
jgi:hypothetical protein